MPEVEIMMIPSVLYRKIVLTKSLAMASSLVRIRTYF